MFETIKDLEEYLTPFDELAEWVDGDPDGQEATRRFNIYNDHLNLHVNLPEWVTLPEPKEFHVIEAVAPYEYEVSFYGEIIRTGDDILELYDSITGDIQLLGDYSHVSEASLLGSIFIPLEGGSSRILISYTDSDRCSSLRSQYLISLKTALNYMKRPDNFLTAWRFIDTHLYNWYLPKGETSWRTDGACQNIEIRPYRTDVKSPMDAEVFIDLTPLSAMEERDSLGLDVRLEVSAKTFEQGIIELAARIHQYYTIFGEERKKRN